MKNSYQETSDYEKPDKAEHSVPSLTRKEQNDAIKNLKYYFFHKID